MKRNLYALMLLIVACSSLAFGMEHKESQRIVSAEQCQEVHQRAKQAYQNGDFSAALSHFSRVILNTQQQNLHSEALIYVADIYFQGNKDVESSYKNALIIAERAAEFPETKSKALLLMGAIYAKGDKSVKQDHTKALELLNSAYSNDECLNTCVDLEQARLYCAVAIKKSTHQQDYQKATKLALKYFQQAAGRKISCCPELLRQAKVGVELAEKNNSKNS